MLRVAPPPPPTTAPTPAPTPAPCYARMVTVTRYTKATWEAADDAEVMLREVAAVVPRSALVRAACACARVALVHVARGETHPLRAITTAEAWADGRATVAEAQDARAAANSAYAAANAAVPTVLYDVLCGVVQREAQRHMASLVREHLPWSTLATAYAAPPRAARRR